jgi:hypothetical protein
MNIDDAKSYLWVFYPRLGALIPNLVPWERIWALLACWSIPEGICGISETISYVLIVQFFFPGLSVLVVEFGVVDFDVRAGKVLFPRRPSWPVLKAWTSSNGQGE